MPGSTPRKAVLYGTLAALGVFWAEASCFNIPAALLHPPLYLAYGLLYVLFVDALMRRGERRFAVWYLFGMLVGLITETYVAKVTFHGLGPGNARVLGVSPGAIGFVIMFYHAFFSFLAPMYAAKRLLGLPLPIRTSPWRDALCLAAPILLFPAKSTCLLNKGMAPGAAAAGFMISAVVLAGWVLALRRTWSPGDVLLSRGERTGVLGVTLVLYALAVATCTNKQAHGRPPLDFPVPAMLVVTAAVAGLLFLLHRSMAGNPSGAWRAPYAVEDMNVPLFSGWLLWHAGITALLAAAGPALEPVRKPGLLVLGAGGFLTGVAVFAASLRCVLPGRGTESVSGVVPPRPTIRRGRP